MGRATARAPMEKPSALKAPLFQLTVNQLEEAGRRIVLDLGSISTPMLSLLGRFRCCVEIADVSSDYGLERLNDDNDSDVRSAIAESLLPAHRVDDPVDLVFCWDLLNYLKPAAMTALMSAVAARARPGARAHALIVYSERSMGQRPGRWVPTDDCLLVDQAPATTMIEAPRYSPELLGRVMGGFSIEHARLLANGMQEFLFRLDA